MFPGDLKILDCTATTPDAKLPAWRTPFQTVAGIDHKYLVPGHGPVEPDRRSIDQTHCWFNMIGGQIGARFQRGLYITELTAVPLQDSTSTIAVARYECVRSVMHLMPGLKRDSRLIRNRA